MDKDYIWQADYGNREYLRPFLKQLIQKQDARSLQCIFLAVNNNPYNLEFFIMVSYDEPKENDVKEMITLFETAGLHRRTDVSCLQLIKEAGNRRFNYKTLLDSFSVDSAFDEGTLFFFPERRKLEEMGYHMIPFGKRSRVFISHSSKDKQQVEELLPFLNAADLPVWFDKYDIQVGDSIVDSVQDGIEKSGHVIFWITENFLESKWCKHEMNAFIRKMIEGNVRVISVLDSDVSTQDIPVFIQDKKYIERKDNTVEMLAKAIIQSCQEKSSEAN